MTENIEQEKSELMEKFTVVAGEHSSLVEKYESLVALSEKAKFDLVIS